MPELPEVETTVLGLQKRIIGLYITDIWSNMWSGSILAKNTIKDRDYFPYFVENSLQSKVISVRRRAKYILIDLDNGFTIVIHLRMTGHLLYGIYEQNTKSDLKSWAWTPKDSNEALKDPYNRHIRVVFILKNGSCEISHLVFCDSRKFGTIVIERTSELDNIKLSNLGPEPLSQSFTLEDFKRRLLLSVKKPTKTVLMDQNIISGIGNIYSDEMLHLSHILPTRRTNSLNDEEFSLLYKSMKKVLTRGISFGGDSMSDYRNVDGERGRFQEMHLVYLCNKLPCKTIECSGIIKKEKINGRSAHYCPICQK